MAFALHIGLSQATPQELNGTWYEVDQHKINSAEDVFLENPLQVTQFNRADGVKLTGGHFLYIAHINIAKAGEYVLDFKNSSTIGRFRHKLYNQKNQLIANVEGGIQSAETNPFFLRHGREVNIAAGDYTIATELISTFYLAIPEPYLDNRTHYQQAIKWGNVVTLLCLGVFIGLGFYYTALAGLRTRWAEAMYAIFILGNFIYNSAALLLLSDMLAVHSIYLVSIPVLFSNIAYVIFVMQLLKINKQENKLLYHAGLAVIGIMILFIIFALLKPNWGLELCRYGVFMFLSYGLATAVTTSLKGNATARRYLIAVTLFFVLGLLSISLTKLDRQFTFYIEHMGLLSVAIEVILLALVVSFQFSQLQKDKEKADEERDDSVKTALTDALTGLPNRHALVKDVTQLPKHGSLSIIDVDGLKFYNDTFGHERGDELLRTFAQRYQQSLGESGKLYRLGGDEFSVISQHGKVVDIESALNAAIVAMKADDYEFAGASLGSVHSYESASVATLMRIADARMYEVKRLRKLGKNSS